MNDLHTYVRAAIEKRFGARGRCETRVRLAVAIAERDAAVAERDERTRLHVWACNERDAAVARLALGERRWICDACKEMFEANPGRHHLDRARRVLVIDDPEPTP